MCKASENCSGKQSTKFTKTDILVKVGSENDISQLGVGVDLSSKSQS